MIDNHIFTENWGVKPTLFWVGSFGVPTYSFFVLLGLLVGLVVYYFEAKKRNKLNENGLLVAFGSITGGILGSKILVWVLNFKSIFGEQWNWLKLLSGRTVVGGLIGGMIGAKITKKYFKINSKMGNLLAPAVAMGVAIGRWGCFFQGCCFGKPTSLPWGVNFGDGVLRHPTQIYESIFMLIMFIYLEKIKDNKNIKPGELFKRLMVAYFVFRFFIEFIRVNPVVGGGLTAFQIISLVAIIYLTREQIISFLKKYGRK